jgi:predicted transcriptional regulator of viral defense system
MNVKEGGTPLQRLQKRIKAQNGILFSLDLAKLGIHRSYLSILKKRGEVERVSRGIYQVAQSMPNEMANIQARYKRAVFSHETAAFLHDLSDRAPLQYSVTVPSGYNATALKSDGLKVFFVHINVYPLGLIPMKSPHGNTILTTNLERTICDLIRNRNQVDIQILKDALKKYVKSPFADLTQLFTYAQQFRIQRIVRQYIEILL